MLCPKCSYPQYCDCENCVDKIPLGFVPYIVTGDDVTCAKCGFTEHHGWWMEYEWDIAVEAGVIERPLNYGVFVDWDGVEINYI